MLAGHPSPVIRQRLEAVPDDGILGDGETGYVGWVSESSHAATGLRTNAGLVLPEAGSSVDAVVLGSEGNELGRRTFSGGPQAFLVGVREIASGDLSLWRGSGPSRGALRISAPSTPLNPGAETTRNPLQKIGMHRFDDRSPALRSSPAPVRDMADVDSHKAHFCNYLDCPAGVWQQPCDVPW
jgi:hypothetical protein